MSYAILSPKEHIAERRKTEAERPLAVRLAFFILPPGLLLCLFVSWLGYRAASTTLEEALPAVPLLEAKIQAEKIEQLLVALNNGLLQIAQLPEHNAQTIHASLAAYLHDALPFVAEFGLKAKENDTFLFLRDAEDRLVPVSPGLASQDPHAPFAQIEMSHMQAGAVTLFPAVQARYAPAPDRRLQSPVIRLALPLDRDRGTLVLGLDLARLHAMLAAYMGSESPLRTPMRDDDPRLAFFFEQNGWMLFELGNQSASGGFFPDA